MCKAAHGGHCSPNAAADKYVCWLFCTVIDNFGDIGVSWRLAQQLHARLGWQVHLWLDDMAALHTIAPDAPATLPCRYGGIALHAWRQGADAGIQAAAPPDLVVEMFACTLPENVLQIIRRRRPLWLNWEYLSAEDWAVRTHAMPSLQADGSRKFFWQMGFVPESGGLIREDEAAPAAFRQPEADEPLRIFAFGYRNPVWAHWCRTWAQQPRPIELHCSGGHIIDSLKHSRLIPQSSLNQDGSSHRIGSLKLVRSGFVPQNRFDARLAQFHINIVRGEDSFIRAQYAALPFFWQIYPQQDNAHLDKLHAFWRHIYPLMPPHLADAHAALSGELNGSGSLNDDTCRAHWHTLLHHLPQWHHAAQTWQRSLFAQSDSVSRLAAWLAQQ